MIPILYDSKETDFTRNGIGFLKDCISCTVTEERNGTYEATFKYPIAGWLFSEITTDRIVKLKANETSELQLFRIYKPSKPLNGIVTFKAQHISYDLNINPVLPFTIDDINANTALSEVLDNCCFEHNFKAVSDIETISKLSIETPVSARNCLGGMSGSILDNFGGEYEFDNFTVKLHKQRGADNGVSIEYGKNLTGLTFETDISNTYTSIMPYAKSNETVITLPEKTIQLDSASNFGCARCKIVDFSSYFGQNETINTSTLREKAKSYLKANAIDDIKTSVKVSFVHLWQSKEYEKYALLERVRLCDTVSVKYNALGVSVKTKVIKTTYDTLNERYTSLELGEAKSNFASTMNNVNFQMSSMQTAINEQPSVMQKAIDNATDIITGQKGGNILLYPKEQPQELLIMNSNSIETATKMWRFNIGGLGHSKNGYNGPFGLAITMDGQIVADYITAGTLNANLIKAGVLQGIKIIAETGSIAGWKMQNGILISDDGTMELDSVSNKITVNDTDGNALMTINKSGVRFWRGESEIGKIGITSNSSGTAYGLTFDLIDGDAMTWSVYDATAGAYHNKVRYTKENGFVVYDDITGSSVNATTGSINNLIVKSGFTYGEKKFVMKYATLSDGQQIQYVGWE